MSEHSQIKCIAPRGCGCDLWNRKQVCDECIARKCENIRKLGQKAKSHGVENYIEQVIKDAFAVEERTPDASYTLLSINDIGYILILRTASKRVFRRVGFRLYNNFHKNFNKDIFVFNHNMMEVLLPEEKYRHTGYGIDLTSNSHGHAAFDANHAVAYVRDTQFGDIAVAVFPMDGGPLDGALYPGYSNTPGEGRILFNEISQLRGDKMYRCKGRNAWNSYVKDYKQLCDGLTPDHAVHIKLVREILDDCAPAQTEQPDQPLTAEEPQPISLTPSEPAVDDAEDGFECADCIVHYPEDEQNQTAENQFECADCVVRYPEDREAEKDFDACGAGTVQYPEAAQAAYPLTQELYVPIHITVYNTESECNRGEGAFGPEEWQMGGKDLIENQSYIEKAMFATFAEFDRYRIGRGMADEDTIKSAKASNKVESIIASLEPKDHTLVLKLTCSLKEALTDEEGKDLSERISDELDKWDSYLAGNPVPYHGDSAFVRLFLE
jgi:hypothetical protein